METQVRIANPMYDVVFRYMMEDMKVARIFLSAILDKQIDDLVFKPTEYTRKLGGEAGITVTRMDFSAKITEVDGSEQLVIIELQKAKFHHQLMRFRRYLGKQYQNPENISAESQQPLPIYPIYILGESFTQTKVPVIRVARGYIDAGTGHLIAERHPFIEALTHDATVIQAEHLSGNRRNLLEQFLAIFDQTGKHDPQGHILSIRLEDYPQKYHPVIRRLQKAMVDPEVEEEMELEDDFLLELHHKDELIDAANQKLFLIQKEAKELKRKAKEQEQKVKEQEQKAKEQEQKAKEQEQKAKEQEQKAKEQERKAKEQERKAKEQERKAKEQERKAKEQEQKAKEQEQKAKEAKLREEEAQTAKNRLIQKLADTGMSVQQIAQLTELSENDIQRILAEK